MSEKPEKLFGALLTLIIQAAKIHASELSAKLGVRECTVNKWIRSVHLPRNKMSITKVDKDKNIHEITIKPLTEIIKVVVELVNEANDIEIEKNVTNTIKAVFDGIENKSFSVAFKEELLALNNLNEIVDKSLRKAYRENIIFKRPVLDENTLKKYEKIFIKFEPVNKENNLRNILLNQSQKNLDPKFHDNEISNNILPYVTYGEINPLNITEEYTRENHLINILRKIQKSSYWHSVIVGEGGMAKTTLMLKCWSSMLKDKNSEPVPIYIELNKFNISEFKKNFIMRTILEDYILKPKPTGEDENKLYEFLKSPLTLSDGTVKPQIVLLLDGYNEITKDKRKLILELQKIKDQLHGVQMVISSRYDLRENLSWNKFNRLDLQNLTTEQIENYLKEKCNFTCLNARLNKILSNPMMLSIFVVSCNIIEPHRNNPYFNWKNEVESPGEILWDYVEAQHSSLISKHPENSELLYYYKFLLRQILPSIGYYMEENQKFNLPENEFETVINNTFESVRNKEFFYVFRKYRHCRTLLLASLEDKFKSYEEVTKILINELGLIKIDNNKYRFSHFHFKDFFTSLHILNSIKHYLSKKSISPLFKKQLSKPVLKFISEIEGLHYNKHHNELPESNITEVFSLLKYDFNDNGYALYNIISMLKYAREKDLSGIDFSNLNLENIHLTNIKFSDDKKHRYSKFNYTNLDDNNIIYQGHSNYISSLAYFDGKIASASWDNTIKIWNSKNYELIKTLEAHKDLVTNIIYSEDKLISASWDGYIIVWDKDTYKCIYRTTESISPIYSLKYGDGKIFTGSKDKIIRIWDIDSLELLGELKGHTNAVSSLAFGEGKLFSGSYDGTIKVWDIKNKKCIKTLEAHDSAISCILYDIGKIFSGSSDKLIKIWDTKTFKCEKILNGHTDTVYCLIYTRDMLISGSADKKINVWDIDTGEVNRSLSIHTSSIYCLIYAAGKLISGSGDSTINIWEITTYELKKTIEGDSDFVSCVFFAGDKLLSSSGNKIIKVWEQTNDNNYKDVMTLEGHNASVEVVISVDNKIVSGSMDSDIRIWDLETGALLHKLEGHLFPVTTLDHAYNKVISGSWDNTIKIWDIEKGYCICTIQGHSAPVESVFFYNDMIFTGSGDRKIKVWNFYTHELIKTFKGHSASVSCILVKGSKVISGSWDNTIRIWDFETEETIHKIKAHTSSIFCLTMFDDKIVSGSLDETVKIWDANTYELITTLHGHSAGINSVAYKDGMLVSGDLGNIIKIWDVETYKCVDTFINVKKLFINNCEFKNLKKKLSNKSKEVLMLNDAVL
jgi:WD40 repeat protein